MLLATINLRTSISCFLIFILGSCQEQVAGEQQSSVGGTDWFYWSVHWHPKGDRIVAGGSNDSYMQIFESADLTTIKHYPYLGTITQTRWHPTEQRIAVAVQDGKSRSAIFNVDAATWTELDQISPEGARALEWDPIGELLAIGDSEGFLHVFDRTGKHLRKVNTNQKCIIGLSWHPTEQLIVGVGEYISWYDLKTDRLQTIEDRDEDVLMLCVDWHPDGTFFATATTVMLNSITHHWSNFGPTRESVSLPWKKV